MNCTYTVSAQTGPFRQAHIGEITLQRQSRVVLERLPFQLLWLFHELSSAAALALVSPPPSLTYREFSLLLDCKEEGR